MHGLLKVSFCAVLLALVAGENLVWEDNFDTLDEAKWSHLVTGSDNDRAEFQYYRNNRRNSYVEDGILKIRASPVSEDMSDWNIRYGIQYDSQCNKEPCIIYGRYPEGNTTKIVYSARLHTQDKFTFKYGRVEVRAKAAQGDWLKSEIWMRPNNDSVITNPNNARGEMDILQVRGNKDLRDVDGRSVGVDNARQAVLYGDFPWLANWETALPEGSDYSDGFHTYGMEWTPDTITYSIDDHVTGQVFPVEPNPFDQESYIILSLAVGGEYFFTSLVNVGGTPWSLKSGRPWSEWYDAQMAILDTWQDPVFEIDYVRVYDLSA